LVIVEEWLSLIPWRIKVTGRHQESRDSSRRFERLPPEGREEEGTSLAAETKNAGKSAGAAD
jgi:hypothetical protein